MTFREEYDLVDNDYLSYLQNLLLGEGFPWYYLHDVACGDEGKADNKGFSIGFSHELFGEDRSQYLPMFDPVLKALEKRLDKRLSFSRLRLGLYVSTGRTVHNEPHIDRTDSHQAAVFYFNDSDGDTVVFDKEGKVVFRSKPKANKVFIFDGLQYHASTNPTTVPSRVILNMNFSY